MALTNPGPCAFEKRDFRLLFAVVLAVVAATTAKAQEFDIGNKTIIVENGNIVEHIYIAPSGRIYFHSSNHPGIGLEYELGKIIRRSRLEEWGPSKGQTCVHETQATFSNQLLTMSLLSATCNGRKAIVSGGGLEIEIKGETCKARYASSAPCRVVTGRQLPSEHS
jgi:hypothetical protein